MPRASSPVLPAALNVAPPRSISSGTVQAGGVSVYVPGSSSILSPAAAVGIAADSVLCVRDGPTGITRPELPGATADGVGSGARAGNAWVVVPGAPDVQAGGRP